MIALSRLGEVIADQLKHFQEKDPGIPRQIDIDKYRTTKQITVISGIRRSGKSTLLAQFSKLFNGFYYINFDDERLIDFTVKDFDGLMTAFQKQYPAKTVFLDEVQNIAQWERFIRRIHDEGYKIFLTGSNARLLSSELATHLTGRYVKIELYPFSFQEFLRFHEFDAAGKGTAVRVRLLKYFDEYFAQGGFPEFVKYGDWESVKRIYDDVLYRDLLTRFRIREVKSFKQLASFLFANVAKEISYNALKNILGFKSVMSVKNYIAYLEESFLIFEVHKYDVSLKKQFVSNKKIYVIDNGMRNSVAFYTSEDMGRLLENLVFLELKRRGFNPYYYKGKRECDFVIKEKNVITSAIQVSTVLNAQNREREIGGLAEAIETLRAKHGLILTKDISDEIKIGTKKIQIKPVYQWLLETKTIY